MSPEAVGVAGIVVLLVLFLLKVPIAFAMLMVGVGGFVWTQRRDRASTFDPYVEPVRSPG